MGVQASTSLGVSRNWVPCPVCTARESVPYLEARGYSVVRCTGCGLRYVNPQPSAEELNEVYAGFDQGSQWRSGEEHFNRGVRKAILRFKRSGAALDIGSGSGNFLRGLREAGFSVKGVEPSASGAAYAQSVHGIETFNGTIEDFLAGGERRPFDVVTILNVLEHLRDPAAVLLDLHRWLRPDGILVVVVPDARFHAAIGTIRRWLGFLDPFWMNTERHPLVGFDPPYHLYSFEPRTLSLLLEGCGYRPLHCRHAPVIFNQDGWKNYAKLLMRSVSEIVHQLSLRQFLWGYSTLVVARKT